MWWWHQRMAEVAADEVEGLRGEFAAQQKEEELAVERLRIEALEVEEQVAEKLLESAKVKAIDMSYADVMKNRKG